MTDYEAVVRVIRARRTNMLVDPTRDVSDELIHELCEVASWAPCHKRTWPWRFAVARGDGRFRLGDVVSVAVERHGDDATKVAKARTKYARTPVHLVVGSAPGDTALRTAENRDATAVAVQNLMLAATARGVSTYWGSCPVGANDDVAALCGFETGTTIVAMVYLGWPNSSVAVPDRPAPIVNRID